MPEPKLEDMELQELFQLADEIGDKYLEPEEVSDRDAKMEAIANDLRELVEEMSE